MGKGACREESSIFPTRSASGSRFIAGVEGGGQVFEVAGFGVTAGFIDSIGFITTFASIGVASVCCLAAWRFSFSAKFSLLSSPAGAPSMN